MIWAVAQRNNCHDDAILCGGQKVIGVQLFFIGATNQNVVDENEIFICVFHLIPKEKTA